MTELNTNFGDWRDYHYRDGICLAWTIDGKIIEFEIVREVEFPTNARVIKHAVFEDHLEELLYDGIDYYRHVGGGRGFFWTQLLRKVSGKGVTPSRK